MASSIKRKGGFFPLNHTPFVHISEKSSLTIDTMFLPIILLLVVQAITASPADFDSKFSLDDRRLQMDELSKTVREVNTAVMGIAELIVEIDRNVRSVYTSVVKRQKRSVESVKVDETLVKKVEKLVSSQDNPALEKAKEEIEKQIEFNFLKTLAAILITGPVRAQERQSEILKLMKSTLNGELDFKPVIDKLPFILRESETNRFISLLKSIRETERTGGSPSRQLGGLQSVDKILDAASKINVKEVGQFLKEIPEIFEGVESIVEGVDEHLTEL